MRSRIKRALFQSFTLIVVAVFSSTAYAQPVWTQIAGTANDVAVGADGTVWHVGATSPLGMNDTVSRWTGSAWEKIREQAARIAVGPDGLPWIVNQAGRMYAMKPGGFVFEPLRAMDVSIGANGAAWAIGTDRRVHRKVGGAWQAVDGSAERIAVDPAGNPWVVNAGNQIWRWMGTSWTMVDGRARDVAISPEGDVYIVSTVAAPGGFQILRRQGASWTKVDGAAGVAVAAGPRGVLYVAQGPGRHLMVSTQTAATVATAVAPPAAPPAAPAAPAALVPTSPAPGAPAPPPTLVTGGTITVSIPVAGPGMPATSPPPAPSGIQGTLVTGGQLVPGADPAAPVTVSGVLTLQQPMPGSLICPIIVTGARLQKGCSFVGAPALFLRKAPPSTCANGSFFDPQNGGECWICPATMVRNVSPVTSDDACWKPVGEEVAKATLQRYTGCAPGFFSDPRNGGECWQCPSGFNRTLDAVTWSTACSKGVFGPFSYATQGQKPGQCTGSAFFDMIDGGSCWTCPVDYRRTANSVKSDAACAKTIPTQYSKATIVSGCADNPRIPGYGTPFRDPQNGGECWVCPIPLKRSASAVSTKAEGNLAACVVGSDTKTVVWQSPQYPEPGVFAFSSGLVEMAMADPKRVDDFLAARANGDPAKKRELWTRMRTNPGESAELKALLLASLISAANEPSPPPAARSALAAFESYARARRVFVAEEATRMYNAWGDVDAYNQYQAARRSSGAGGMDVGVLGASPDDFISYAGQVAMPDSSGAVLLEAFQTLGGQIALGRLVTNTGDGFKSEYLLPVWKGLEKSLDKFDGIAGMMSTSSVGNFGPMGKMLQSVGKGAFIAMTVASSAIDLASGITVLIDKAAAEKKYASLVPEASKPYSVKAMLASANPEDQQTVLLYWALATSPYRTGPRFGEGRIDSAAQCAELMVCQTAKAAIENAARRVGY